jgi:hypothetical protein
MRFAAQPSIARIILRRPGGPAPVPTTGILYRQLLMDGIFRSVEEGRALYRRRFVGAKLGFNLQ